MTGEGGAAGGRRRATAFVLGLGVLALAAPGSADPGDSFRSRFGVAAALADLNAKPRVDRDPASLRRAAIERLGRIGTRHALAELNRVALRSDLSFEDLVLLARALAPHAREAETRSTLGRLLAEPARPALERPEPEGPASLSALMRLRLGQLGSAVPPSVAAAENEQLGAHVRAIAALGLARDGSVPSLRVLVGALRRDEVTAGFAREALLAHPPRDLAPLLAGPPSAPVARLLGELGDQRAFDVLRAWVRRSPTLVQTSALESLFRLGALEAVELAAVWLERRIPAYRETAATILIEARAPQALTALEVLLDAGEAETALELVRRAPNPAFLEELTSAHERLSPADSSRLFAIVAGLGSDASVDWLVEQLAVPEKRSDAAFALARTGAPRAIQALKKAARGKERALALHALTLADHLQRTTDAAELLAAPRVAEERFVSEWAASLQSPARAEEAMTSKEVWRAIAASHTAWRQPESFFVVAGETLESATNDELSIAASVALTHPSGAARVSTRRLFELYAALPLLRPVLVYALAQRDDPMLRPRIEQWVDSKEVVLRRATLLGLGACPDPWSVGVLARRLEVETDPVARYSAIIALSRHREKTATAQLAVLRDFEPTAAGRAFARAAAGAPLSELGRGDETLWLELVREPEPRSPGFRSDRVAVSLHLAPALTVALLPGPSRVLVVPGLASETFGLSAVTWYSGPEPSR